MRIIIFLVIVLLLTACGSEKKNNRIDKLMDEAFRYDSLKDYKRASAIYDEILSLSPGNTIALMNKGRVMAMLGDTAAALAFLDRSQEILPTPEVALMKGILIGQKDKKAGLSYLHAAWALNKDYILPIQTLAMYYSEVVPIKDSAYYYAHIISEKAPSHEPTLLTLMGIYLTFPQHDSLIAVTNRLLEINPGYPYAFNNRGYAKLKTGDYNGARIDIYHSLTLDSTNSYAYKNLGLLFIELKKKDSACLYLIKAKEKNFKQEYGNEVDSLLTIHCH